MKNLLFFLVLTVLLPSCGAKYITIVDQVLPAKVPFPEEIKSITLLDRARESNLGVRLGSGTIYSQGHVQLLRNCAGRLPYQTTVYPKSIRDSNAGSPAHRMNRDEVATYVGSTQAVFSLEQLFFQEERRTVEYDKHQLDENGDDYYVKAIRGTKISSLDALWRLYDGRTGSIVLELPYSLEDVFEAEALDYQSVNAKLDTLHTVDVQTMAATMVDRLLADVSPTPIESNWLYYTKGNDLVERSAAYLEAGRYSAAARIVEENQRIIPQLKKPERAQYNWATALFLDGQHRRAEEVAREGYTRYRKSEFTQLIQKINTY